MEGNSQDYGQAGDMSPFGGDLLGKKPWTLSGPSQCVLHRPAAKVTPELGLHPILTSHI